MGPYSLTFVNNSNMSGTPAFCIYQTLPNYSGAAGPLMSAAWQTIPLSRGNSGDVSWEVDWGLNYTYSPVSIGSKVTTALARNLPIDPASTRLCQAVLSESNMAYKLDYGSFMPNPDGHSIYVQEDGTIDPGASVGLVITMADHPVFAGPAGPNLELVADMHPVYWVMAGYFTNSQILDTTMVTQPTPVTFTGSQPHWTAIFEESNLFTVQPTETVNFARMLVGAGR